MENLQIPARLLAAEPGAPEPAAGARAGFTIEGTVVSSSGGRVTIRPETINGQPVDADAPTGDEAPGPDEADALESRAREFDGLGPDDY